MNNLTLANPGAAVLATVDMINALGPAVIEADEKGWREQARVAAALENALAGSPDPLAAIADAARPAPEKVVATHLALLLKAFRDNGKDDAGVFGKLLLGDAIDQRPSAVALEVGCAKIRRTCKFPPSIAEILEAIGEVDSRLRAAKIRIERFPDQLAALKRSAAEGERAENLRKGRGGEAA